MPSESISDVKIGSRASTRAGLDPVTSFQDGTAEATVLEDNYDAVVDNALSLYAWRFARKTVALQQLASGAVSPYGNAYQLPQEAMKLHKLTINGWRTTDYDLSGLVVSCHAGDNDTVEAMYTYRADESLWHPTFVEYIVLRLAAILADSVRKDRSQAESLNKDAEIQWRRAKFAVSQESSTESLQTTRLIAIRQ